MTYRVFGTAHGSYFDERGLSEDEAMDYASAIIDGDLDSDVEIEREGEGEDPADVDAIIRDAEARYEADLTDWAEGR